MSLERSAVRGFDGFELDIAAHELRRQGKRIRLQEQPFQILSLLLEHAGQVVTREELRRKVWPSSVYVDFDHGLNNAIARLRDALDDDREAPRYIETLPRIGYRFVCQVDETAAPPAQSDGSSANDAHAVLAAPSPVSTGSGWRRSTRLVAAAVLLGAAAVLLIVWAGHWRSPPVPSGSALADPSLAVLPFANLSSDKENEYFADGLTEALVTKLAAIHGLKVVARTSSFRFKGRQESAGSIAQALHVNHLLEGSVSRAGTQLRITAQLIDARSDAHMWSQTFDRRAGDIFKIQDEIAFAVAAALKVSLLNAEEFRIRSHGTSDPEAYRLYLIAYSHLAGSAQTADKTVAKRALEAALARDPKFVAAHAALAAYYFLGAWYKLTDTEEGARLGIAAADRAVALDPNSSEALETRAMFGFWRYRFGGDYQAFVAAQSDIQRAINIDPSNADAFALFGRAVLWNDPDLALSLLEQSIQLDPLSVTGPNIDVAMVLGSRGHLQTARERCEAMIQRFPDRAGTPCRMAIATLDVAYGNFEPTIALMRASEKSVGGATRIQLWAVYMSLGDRAAAQHWLDFGPNAFEKVLSDAARFATEMHYEQAFEVLEQHRTEYPLSHLLDFPTARFALIAGHAPKAREILEHRLPDLVSGVEPVSARNVLPALDLATAQLRTGAGEDGRLLLARIAAYLDGPSALQLPLFTYERARVHALAGETDEALRTLDHAYELGLRTTWALDLRPQSFLYVDPLDADPALTALRRDPRYVRWRDRITADNARQLAHLRATAVPEANATHTD